MKHLLLLIPLLFLTSCFGNEDVTFKKDTLAIESLSGQVHEFDIEIAESRAQHARGLMFRKEIPDNFGMLFLFEEEAILSFWMKNTYVPLDILFIGKDGTIVDIHENAEPLSLKTIKPARPAKGALEVIGGSVQNKSLQIGDRVVHSSFLDQ